MKKIEFEGYYDNIVLNGCQSLQLVNKIKGGINLKKSGINNVEHEMRMLEEIRKLRDTLYLYRNLSEISGGSEEITHKMHHFCTTKKFRNS